MGQTGMETQEILEGITTKIKPCCLLVVDSLATRSVNRLCNTIQITDTGICPGAGIGNNRNKLNQETMKIPVVAIGVPTVVDAGTIVSECMEETLLREGYSMEQIDLFLRGLSRHAVERLFVTPKDIDEQIRVIGKVVANGINQFVSENII
jgi:spore protease